jgi:hypothetical protein
MKQASMFIATSAMLLLLINGFSFPSGYNKPSNPSAIHQTPAGRL